MALNEEWLQEVVSSIELPHVPPSVVRILLPTVEMQVRKLIQQAHKFQRRGKKQSLTVEDFNLALTMNNLEPLYGLFPVSSHEQASSQPTSQFMKVKLVELVKKPLPPYPLRQDLTLHWLAVEGVQPTIPENPTFATPSLLELSSQQQDHIAAVVSTKESLVGGIAAATVTTQEGVSSSSSTSLSLVSLPKEMQLVYLRIIRALESRDSHTVNDAALTAVYEALLTDPAMQILVPHLCLFIYTKVRETSKTLDLLIRLIRAVKSLVLNTSISIEFHLQQLLPAIFTCVVGSQQLSSIESVHTYFSTRTKPSRISSSDTNVTKEERKEVFALSTSNDSKSSWALRMAASEVVSMCCAKYSAVFPDLRSRVLQTYIEGLGVSSSSSSFKSLGTVYGAVAGLSALGSGAVGGVLFPRLPALLTRLEDASSLFKQQQATTQIKAVAKTGVVIPKSSGGASGSKETTQQRQQQQQDALFQLRIILIQTLGRYAMDVLRQVHADNAATTRVTRRSSSSGVYLQPLKKRRRIASSMSRLDGNGDNRRHQQRSHRVNTTNYIDDDDDDGDGSLLLMSPYAALTRGLGEITSVYIAAAAASTTIYSANQLCGNLFL